MTLLATLVQPVARRPSSTARRPIGRVSRSSIVETVPRSGTGTRRCPTLVAQVAKAHSEGRLEDRPTHA
jgi:hypothetical protein